MWLPSRSATLREQHIPFYNRVRAKDDPFWNHNQPGTLWNCKCDWQQVDDPVTQNNPAKTIRSQGLEGNPAKTGKIFSDKASYFLKNPDNTERIARAAYRDIIKKETLTINKGKPFVCQIGKDNLILDLRNKLATEHFAKGMFEDDLYWVKNSIFYNQEILKNAEFVGYKESDLGHNTNNKTLKLKARTDYFYYYKLTIGSKSMYIHFGHYTDTGNVFLYAATSTPPKNIKTS